MESSERTFLSKDGLRLFYRTWRPEAKLRAVLVRLQGIGGHSGMYRSFVDWVIQRGYAVYGLDQRGHGRSEGRRGYINRWTEYQDDLGRFIDLVKAAEPDLPIFLVGFSLGGIVVLDFALKRPEQIQGVVTLNPALHAGIPWVKRRLSYLLSGIWPTLSANAGLDMNSLTRDPAAVKAILEDKLLFHTATARLATEVFAASERVQLQITNLMVPFLLLQGGGDRQAFANDNRIAFERVINPDKEFHLYEGALHFLDWETNREEVFTDCVQWLDQHSSATRP